MSTDRMNEFPQLTGIDHYAVNVADLQRAALWYERVLGFRVVHKWNTTWMVGSGNIKVGLFHRPQATPPPDLDQAIVVQHIAFAVDAHRFAAVQTLLTEKGVSFEGPEDSGIAYAITFKDADGHLLEITTYHA